jgi:Na+/H+-dicarboxylate symporter
METGARLSGFATPKATGGRIVMTTSTLSKITDDAIAAAAAMDDLDRAALHLQTIAGITDGGIAAMCLDEDLWARADAYERIEMLREWLKVEASYEGGC